MNCLAVTGPAPLWWRHRRPRRNERGAAGPCYAPHKSSRLEGTALLWNERLRGRTLGRELLPCGLHRPCPANPPNARQKRRASAPHGQRFDIWPAARWPHDARRRCHEIKDTGRHALASRQSIGFLRGYFGYNGEQGIGVFVHEYDNRPKSRNAVFAQYSCGFRTLFPHLRARSKAV